MLLESKHKVFISYHHSNDQSYKEYILEINRLYNFFIDASVGTGEIDDNFDDQTIRQIIRDDYLRDSSVTLLLVGKETRRRKHIDWELYSSMINGKVNKKSGVLVINLPTVGCTSFTAAHGEEEKAILYPHVRDWMSLNSQEEYRERYPYMPDRIIDNLANNGARISVVNWHDLTKDWTILKTLIDLTFRDRSSCDYDLSRPMRRNDS